MDTRQCCTHDVVIAGEIMWHLKMFWCTEIGLRKWHDIHWLIDVINLVFLTCASRGVSQVTWSKTSLAKPAGISVSWSSLSVPPAKNVLTHRSLHEVYPKIASRNSHHRISVTSPPYFYNYYAYMQRCLYWSGMLLCCESVETRVIPWPTQHTSRSRSKRVKYSLVQSKFRSFFQTQGWASLVKWCSVFM